MAAHWDGLTAADFFTVEVLTWRGLVRYAVFFVMELKTRTVEIAGITRQPDDLWMTQMARNLTDVHDGFLRHPAGLNFGDVFAYALARTSGEPLLFKGDDFSKTDVGRVS